MCVVIYTYIVSTKDGIYDETGLSNMDDNFFFWWSGFKSGPGLRAYTLSL